MTEWFKDWFGARYLEVYPHRNDAEAEAQIAFILRHLPRKIDFPVLDLACGSGRHLQALSTQGIIAIGIDLSRELLREAGMRSSVHGRIAQADMRSLPLQSGAFAVILSMFTSFGYFNSLDEHMQLLHEVSRLLMPGGVFLLDYLNPVAAINNLIPLTHRETPSFQISEARSILGNNDRIEKEITITDKQTNRIETFRESVALFSPMALIAMLAHAELMEMKTFGNFDGQPYTSESPRCIIFAEKLQ